MGYLRFMQVVVLALCLFSGSVQGNDGRLTLLAVTQDLDGTLIGTTADLLLEIRPGNGRVFIDSLPLTKIDTQISARLAKDIACNYVEVDCSRYDFFFTIHSDSPIIGGPSAGAATALLTSFVLLGIDYDHSVAVTGTINSGGIIGPVGGVSEKIVAARNEGMVKVLVPIGEGDLVGLSEGIEVVTVSTLDDAMYEFTGRRKVFSRDNITLPQEYEVIMRGLADELCQRARLTRDLVTDEADLKSLLDSSIAGRMADAKNLSSRAAVAYEGGSYYSAASHCFGSSVVYKGVLLEVRNQSIVDLNATAMGLVQDIDVLDQEVDDWTLHTITDLQAYMVVKQRIGEARDNSELSLEKILSGEKPFEDLAFGIERLESARLWSGFFGAEGTVLQLDREVLRQSCLSKISEAQERYHYSTAYVPGMLSGTLVEIEKARQDYAEGEYALCLFKASKAKAEADIVLNTVSVAPDGIDELISQKLSVVESVIVDAIGMDMFPIVGYSYYEYARTLSEYDKYSALLYAEYALELSNFEVYFERRFRGRADVSSYDIMVSLIFFFGFITGVAFTLALFFPRTKKVKKTRQASPRTEMLAGKKR